jgi:hypothetical protein
MTRRTQTSTTKITTPEKQPVEVAKPVLPASLDDFSARVRNSPVTDLAVLPTPSASLPQGPEAFAQRELRKLDADLAAESDRALAELSALDPSTRAKDLGPVSAQLEDVSTLLARRRALRGVATRLERLAAEVRVQQQVADHDAVLALEAVGQALSFYGRFDRSIEERYAATLALLAQRGKKVAEGIAQARSDAPTS